MLSLCLRVSCPIWEWYNSYTCKFDLFFKTFFIFNLLICFCYFHIVRATCKYTFTNYDVNIDSNNCDLLTYYVILSQREITLRAMYHYENAWQWYLKKDMFISSFMKINADYFLSEKYKEWEGRAVEKVWTAKSWNQTTCQLKKKEWEGGD